eukprot:1622951-Pyramimonas_sp.AAC.1
MNKESAQLWSEWCAESVSRGARALHRLTKVKAIPEPAQCSGPVVSGSPVAIVEKEVEMYQKLWKASGQAPYAWVPDRSTCP